MTSKEELLREETVNILTASGKERKNLIPILQKIQEKLGYLPREAMQDIARFMEISEATVYGVATFYNQFRFNPPGKHPIRVCVGTACHIRKGRAILDSFERKLGIKVGETTPDREFSLERVACVGCCVLAPVAVVEDSIEGKMSPMKVDGILLAFDREREKEKRESNK